MSINKLVTTQRTHFNSNITKNIKNRIIMLSKLRSSVEKFEQKIYSELYADLGKSQAEAYLTEISLVASELELAIRKLRGWATPCRMHGSLASFPSDCFVMREPYGVVLILSPWNYPFQLTLLPLIGAIAAGNCAVIKLSESSPHTSSLLREMINSTFAPEFVQVIDENETHEAILSEKYDYIFFTGSERVGKIVMEAASKHLTPVCLELGGKSPCIVSADANINLAAKRIIWGKLINAGQTCVAPDYVLVDSKVKDKLINQMMKYIYLFYNKPLQNSSYPKIINRHHFDRLTAMVDNEENKLGGEYDIHTLKLAPTIFTNASFDDEIMSEEIFGPILPVIEYTNILSVIDVIKQRPKPLACYVFTEDMKFAGNIIKSISFGGGCINDTITHVANHNLPFGGVGSSGMGAYHGYHSFKTFSHEKAIVKASSHIDLPMKYPPYSELTLKLLKAFLK